MPQITITFSPEEHQEALDAINVPEYKFKINRVLELIRQKKKYDENVSEETMLLLEEIRDILED